MTLNRNICGLDYDLMIEVGKILNEKRTIDYWKSLNNQQRVAQQRYIDSENDSVEEEESDKLLEQLHDLRDNKKWVGEAMKRYARIKPLLRKGTSMKRACYESEWI